MASEDVLDRLDRMMNGEASDSRSDLEYMCEALAAEVRELRKDKARLDWLCEQTGEGLLLHATRGGCEVEWSGYGLGTLGGTRTLRAAIDAAMEEERT